MLRVVNDLQLVVDATLKHTKEWRDRYFTSAEYSRSRDKNTDFNPKRSFDVPKDHVKKYPCSEEMQLNATCR